MKVTNIILSTGKTGLERTHFDYAKYLRILGYDTEVVIAKKGRFKKEFQELGVKVSKIGNKLSYLDLRTLFKIRNLLKKSKTDVAIAHDNKSIFLTRLAALGVCPVIGINYKSISKSSFGCHSIVTVNSEMKKIVADKGVDMDKVYVIPNSIEIPEKLPVKKRVGKTITVGTLGKLSLDKGFIHLTEAMNILKEKYDNIRLVMAGSGPDKHDMQRAIDKKHLHSKIEFLGWVNDKEKLFNKIDIFCLPALDESFGFVLLEAALRKKPIITTDTAGPSDIFKHKKNAYIVRRGKSLKHFPRRLAKAIEILANDKELRNSINKEGHELVIKNYSHKAVAKKLDVVLKETVKNYKK